MSIDAKVISADTLQTLNLSSFTSKRRRLSAPKHKVSEAWIAGYDDDTFIYDCFFARDGRTVEIVGPPLLGLRRMVERFLIGGAPANVDCVDWEHLARWRIDGAALKGGEPLEIVIRNKRLRLPLFPPRTDDAFDDKKVIIAKFRFEPIAWVRDWLEYHVRAHGVEAALIYCNDLPDFTPSDALEELATIPGLETLRLVEWNFPFGAPKLEEGKHQYKNRFCQLGALEHARLRFLTRARAVVQLDVDELLVGSGGAPVIEKAEDSCAGHVRFRTRQIFGDADTPPRPLAERRHRHFDRLADETHIGTHNDQGVFKWIAFPRNQGPDVNWRVHQVVGDSVAFETASVWANHFKPMNMGWKNPERAGLVSSGPRCEDLIATYRRIGWRQ